jgi:serine/threonine protein kinase
VKQRVGSYEIVRVLARGGMAAVFLAHQPALDRDVALKQLELQGADTTLAQRFVREARLAAALDHPNVVTLFDFFEHGGVPYIAMEYVGGGSLRPLVGSLSLPQVFGVLEGLLAGLAHAEAYGIAHRDLKPENVLITRGGGVKIADFGIARAYNVVEPSLTSTGSAIGTPTYMAPEQALGEPLGPQTDIYALGVVAYELLAGRPPFEPGASPMAVLYCHVNKAPPPLTELAPDVPEGVYGWVEWLLAKRAADRPASAAEAWESLEEIAVAELGPYWRRSAAITAPEPDERDRTTLIDFAGEATPLAPGPAPMPPRRRRRRAAAIAGGAALALAAAAVAVWALPSDPPQSKPPPAGAKAKAARPPTAVPYDFDGDGSQELALGMPGSGREHAGVVIVRDGRRSDASADTVLTAADARLGGDLAGIGFGTSLASADFDGDRRADLAISAPGRDLVAVIHGTQEGLSQGRVEHIRAKEIRTLGGAGRYGSRLLASDINRDGHSDLVVGAPAADRGEGGSGLIQIVFGGSKRLRSGAPQTVPRPVGSWVGFGTKLRSGDINGDGNIDLVEGAADRSDGTVLGHGSYCLGRKNGIMRKCVELEGSDSSGTSALAIADVTGDHRDDIIQGDAVAEPAAVGRAAVGGEVRVWRGGRSGPAAEPLVIDQQTGAIPGDDEFGDGFGAGVDAGDLDGDGYADMVVAAPGEDENGVLDAGAVIVIRGGHAGRAATGHSRFFQSFGIRGALTAGAEVGWSIAVLDMSGDGKLDVALSIRGADRIQDSVYLIEGGNGQFAPGETTPWRPLRGVVGVRDPNISRIRIGRADGA